MIITKDDYIRLGLHPDDCHQLGGKFLPRELREKTAALYHSTIWRDTVTRMFLRTLVGLYVYGEIDECHRRALYFCAECADDERRYVDIMKRFWSDKISRFLRVKFRRTRPQSVDQTSLLDELARLSLFTDTFQEFDLSSFIISTNDYGDEEDVDMVPSPDSVWNSVYICAVQCINATESGRVRKFLVKSRWSFEYFLVHVVYFDKQREHELQVSEFLDIAGKNKIEYQRRRRWRALTFY